MQRVIARRTVLPSSDTLAYPHPINLSQVAHAAAVETLQVSLVAHGWVGLFAALLQPGSSAANLVWLAGGPGGEAEIKRAYSALFGRFFGRAVLRHEHGCQDLQQVYDGRELAPNVHIRRRRNHPGDLPDWVSWNSSAGCYSVCEAKGSYDRSDWRKGLPGVVRNALRQVGRVEVVDSAGQLQTKDWVVASRWGTAINGKEPTILTVDPPTEGRRLSAAEGQKAANEIHARFLSDLLRGVGREGLAASLRNPTVAAAGLDDDIAIVGGRPGYAALLVDGVGIVPLRGPQRKQRFEVLRDAAKEENRKVALVGIEQAAVQAAVQRVARPNDRQAVVTDDGLTVSLDGVTVTWNAEGLDLPA